MIRQNKNITGISVNNAEHKLAQFADDTQTFQNGDGISFEETIKILNIFGKISGLNMNCEKTSAVWLGRQRRSTKKYMPHLKMEWNPPKFKILGI